MENTPNAPRSLILSTRLYQALLAIYPSEFRQAYGGPMLQVFGDSCRRALREAGPTGLLSLWRRTVLDTVQTAIEEHSQRGVDMSKEKFIRLSGWAMIAGPFVLLIGAWAKNRPEYSPFNAVSMPIDRYANDTGSPLIVLGLLFLSLGFLGMMLRYAPKLDGAGIMLGIGALAGLASAVGAGMLAVNDNNPWWNLFILGMAGQYLALAFFGFMNLRRRLLPRWNALPILALWFPAAMFLSLGITPWGISIQVFASLWILTCVMFAGLGYLLQSDSQPAGMAAAGG